MNCCGIASFRHPLWRCSQRCPSRYNAVSRCTVACGASWRFWTRGSSATTTAIGMAASLIMVGSGATRRDWAMKPEAAVVSPGHYRLSWRSSAKSWGLSVVAVLVLFAMLVIAGFAGRQHRARDSAANIWRAAGCRADISGCRRSSTSASCWGAHLQGACCRSVSFGSSTRWSSISHGGRDSGHLTHGSQRQVTPAAAARITAGSAHAVARCGATAVARFQPGGASAIMDRDRRGWLQPNSGATRQTKRRESPVVEPADSFPRLAGRAAARGR